MYRYKRARKVRAMTETELMEMIHDNKVDTTIAGIAEIAVKELDPSSKLRTLAEAFLKIKKEYDKADKELFDEIDRWYSDMYPI